MIFLASLQTVTKAAKSKPSNCLESFSKHSLFSCTILTSKLSMTWCVRRQGGGTDKKEKEEELGGICCSGKSYVYFHFPSIFTRRQGKEENDRGFTENNLKKLFLFLCFCLSWAIKIDWVNEIRITFLGPSFAIYFGALTRCKREEIAKIKGEFVLVPFTIRYLAILLHK